MAGKASVDADPEAVRRLALRGLARGLLDDGGLIYVGLRRLVVPVWRDGSIVACLGLMGPQRRLADPEFRRRATRMLRKAARQLSEPASRR